MMLTLDYNICNQDARNFHFFEHTIDPPVRVRRLGVLLSSLASRESEEHSIPIKSTTKI